MSDDFEIGEQVIANGKLATIQQVFSNKCIRVNIVSTGAVRMVGRSDIERIGRADTVGQVSRDANNYTPEQLLVFAERYNAIRQWRSGELSISEVSAALDLSKSYLFRLAKHYDEDLGPVSMALRQRGRKSGVTRLDEEIEIIISRATDKIYTSKAASYSKVWVEVDVTCKEKGLDSPCKDTVARRVKLLFSKKEHAKIKHGKDAASQSYSARPGKKKVSRPLQWVQMDHTLVDVILLDDDRISVIGRPWLTVAIDIKTRVILGYYLSLHVPSTVSVACALSHGILPKTEFAKSLGIHSMECLFYGQPEVLHMDNAAEFTSPKFKVGCASFGIQTEYRPYGRKHYGGHVERLIGTFMTTKVHYLKGTTMSNAVARRGIDSAKSATMTFSDFTRWFAREVMVYHSTIHSELGVSPSQEWSDYYAPNGGIPFPPKIFQPEKLKLYFMPEETRKINPEGIKLHGETYWDPILSQYVGTHNTIVKYDPFNLDEIWVKLAGEFCSIRLSDLTRHAATFEEYRASKIHRKPVRAGGIDSTGGIKAYREKQEIEQSSARLTRAARRRYAAEKAYNEAYPSLTKDGQVRDVPNELSSPDYTVRPKKFGSESQ
ncbi:Mu transposase C-terminal domain-containing protein [Pseudomonas psychrophila]|uniref:Mu transposase C-terminal domain-containing protein n=1 Tax=Pseudomonas psychrophila TaxID=122355 RepID=UPI000356E09D|nr:Mu transposase C-terminal domain-containing protein [Pseudomonas psychrophila]EPJ95841.1 integrase catalytic subunit [Pseudomonas psychrophila]